MKINGLHSRLGTSDLARTSKAISRALERLSTGRRFNRPSDGVSGFNLSTKLDSSIRGVRQGIQNVNRAKGMLGATESAIESQTQILRRMREIAVRASDGTLNTVTRKSLASEVQSLLREFERITHSTEFLGQKILTGDSDKFTLQVGPNIADQIGGDLVSTANVDVFKEQEVVAAGESEVITTDISGFPNYLLTEDLNADGIGDIVIGDVPNDVVKIFLGNGDGTFEFKQELNDSNDKPRKIVDLDGDGNLDIVTMAGDSFSVYSGRGDGLFDQSESSSVTPNLKFVGAIDIDSDGDRDLITAAQGDSFTRTFLNNGDNTFTAGATFAGSRPGIAKEVDFDGDGDLDLISGRFVANGSITIFENNGDGTLDVSGQNTMSGFDTQVEIPDLDGDGDIDIVAITRSNGGFQVFFGDGQGAFTGSTTYEGIGTDIEEGAVGDLDGDGDTDLVLIDQAANEIYTYLNDGTGAFSVNQTISSAGSIGNVELVDYTGDGSLDIVTNGTGDGAIRFYGNDSQGEFSALRTYDNATDGRRFQATDFNNDGILDFIQVSENDARLNVLLTETQVKENFKLPDVSSQAEAQATVDILDYAIDALLDRQAEISTLHSRLDRTMASNLMLQDALSEAESLNSTADGSPSIIGATALFD